MTKLKHKIRAMIDAFKFYMELKTHSKTSNHNRADLRSGMDKHYNLDTSASQEPQTELKRMDKHKIHNFIEEKKNRTPFYKDDNKKTWE